METIVLNKDAKTNNFSEYKKQDKMVLPNKLYQVSHFLPRLYYFIKKLKTSELFNAIPVPLATALSGSSAT